MTVLYIGNLSATVSEDQLRGVIEPYGAIIELVLDSEEYVKEEEEPRVFHVARVTMESEKTTTKVAFGVNGYELEGQRLAVSPAEVNIRPLTSKQRRSLDEIIERLEETEKKPRRMLEAIVMLCGIAFAQAIVEETFQIEAQGGFITKEGDRRRTTGGVFFYLARFRMSPAVRRIVYNRKGKLPRLDNESADAAG